MKKRALLFPYRLTPFSTVLSVLLFLVFIAQNCKAFFYGLRHDASASVSKRHPIEVLVEQGHAQFTNVTSRQSKTLEARLEYERRYNRTTPSGYDGWYTFARQNSITRIDEYDDLMKSLEPLRNLSPQTLKAYLKSVVQVPGMSKISIQDHNFLQQGNDWHEREWRYLFEPILDFLPDMEILMNEWDEPRVLMGSSANRKDPKFMSEKDLNPYQAFVETPCKGYKMSTNSSSEDTFRPYLADVAGSKDICLHPEVGTYYGMIANPWCMSVTESPVPILSQSKISSVGDLTYPSILYIEGLLNKEYKAPADQEWDTRNNDLYWTGRTSNGKASAESDWKSNQRQRFVATVNGLVNNSLSNEFSRDADSYKVRFPAVNQCDEGVCQKVIQYFGVDDKPDAFDEVHKHKFLFDMDGNVFSRRFYSLMFSHSTVLKQTMQVEYFDEWLFPWVHYIPVSMDFEEPPDMMALPC